MSLRDDLVAHWSFEETSGQRADDHGAAALADNNTVLYSASGKVGNAADFELTNSEYLSAVVADVGVAPGDKNLMVACWVKLESKAADASIIQADYSSAERSWRLEYDVNTDRLRFIAFGTTNAIVGDVKADNLGSPSTGTWYYIVAWHSATDNQVGIQINNGTANTAATTGAMGANETQLLIGANGGTGTPANFFDGLIDEAAVWRRLLTTDEKTTLYNSGSGYAWSNWFTDSGIAPLHTAHAADVLAYDATGYTYETTITVTQTGRHAIGVMLLQTDDADQVLLKIGGTTVETITVNDDQLANKFGSYFEDGFIYDFTSTGSKTVKVESVSNASVIKGVIIREPDSFSGIVEDQGTATHCEPQQCTYGADTYNVHVEMYTGDVYLGKNGTLQGKLFDGVNRNEHYHVGAAVVPLAAGVAVMHVGHNYNGLRVRYLPSGSYASITSTYTALSSTSLTYCKAQVLADDRIAVLSRGGTTQSAVVILLSDVDQIDGTGASATADYVFNGAGPTYPNSFEYYINGSTEVLCCLFNSRDASNDWGFTNAALFCPQEGTYGEWYSLNGDAATVNTALGTEGTPRFNITMRDTQTSSGGFLLVGGLGAGQQRYTLSGLFKVTQWPSGATNAKGAVLVSFADSAAAINAYNDSTVARFLIQNEGTRTLDSSFNELPADAELSLAPNSYRLDATFLWEDDDPTGDALLAITDRRWGKTGSGKGATYEECGLYYDWGGHEISVLRIANPHTPASITFAQEKRIEVGTKYRAAFITKAGTNSIIFQRGDNQLHGTHRQTTHQVESVLAGGGATTLTQTATFTDSDTFYAATVSAGAVTLTPSLFSDGDTFYSATVSQSGGAQDITPALFVDVDAFHSATVSAGAVTLAPTLFTDTDTFYTHAAVVDGGPQTLTPGLFADADTFHAATVTPGAVTLAPSLYTDADTFHAAEVTASYNLQPPAFADADAFYAATVSIGAVTLTPGLFEDADTFYSPSIGGGTNLLKPNRIFTVANEQRIFKD